MRVCDAQGRTVRIGDRVRKLESEEFATVVAFVGYDVELQWDTRRWTGCFHKQEFTSLPAWPFGRRVLRHFLVVDEGQDG